LTSTVGPGWASIASTAATAVAPGQRRAAAAVKSSPAGLSATAAAGSSACLAVLGLNYPGGQDVAEHLVTDLDVVNTGTGCLPDTAASRPSTSGYSWRITSANHAGRDPVVDRVQPGGLHPHQDVP
jgi:hypothetical protein